VSRPPSARLTSSIRAATAGSANPETRPAAHVLEQLPELGVGDDRVLAERSAAGVEAATGLRGARQDRVHEARDRHLRGPERDPLGGGPDGRGDDRVERQPTEPTVHVEVAGQAAGDRDGAVADVEDLVRPTEGQRDRHGARQHLVRHPAAGGVDEEVEQHLVTRGGPCQEEPAATEAREHRLGDGRGEPGGHRGVEGVAPGSEHLDGRRHRHRVASGDRGARWDGHGSASGRDGPVRSDRADEEPTGHLGTLPWSGPGPTAGP
jgi:hypothetical protein